MTKNTEKKTDQVPEEEPKDNSFTGNFLEEQAEFSADDHDGGTMLSSDLNVSVVNVSKNEVEEENPFLSAPASSGYDGETDEEKNSGDEEVYSNPDTAIPLDHDRRAF